MKLNSTFEKISRQFKIDFDELASEISHNQLAGEAREKSLIGLLKKYLPHRVGVDRGIVIDAHGEESEQMDVIIYDSTVGTVFDINGIKHFPCETVIAVGEVKSDIKSTAKLQYALDKIKSAKKLDRSNNGKNLIISGPGVSLQGLEFNPTTRHRDQIFGFIFTSTSMTQESVISYLQNHNERTDRRYWMNVFCGFNQYLISYECPKALYPSAMDATHMYCTKEEETPNLLLLFYCILANAVDEIHVARPKYFSYAKIGKTDATYHDLFPTLMTKLNFSPPLDVVTERLNALPDSVQPAIPYCFYMEGVERGVTIRLVETIPTERGEVCVFEQVTGETFRVIRPSLSKEEEAALIKQIREILNEEVYLSD